MDDKWESHGTLHQPRKRQQASAVQSVRFKKDELSAIRKAAASARISTSEFIRQAVLQVFERASQDESLSGGTGAHLVFHTTVNSSPGVPREVHSEQLVASYFR